MAVGKSTYILRFKDGKTKEMLVQFTSSETVRSNLAEIIPKAISQNFLPESCSVDSVELDHKENTLNLDLPLKEQGVREYDVLVLRDMSSLIRMSIRYRPDDSDPAMESVTVKPKAVLNEAMRDFSERVRSEYTFYGRKVKKFNLLYGKRKLNLKKSLSSQGIKNDIEVTFKPRIWFEWPPRLIWPPGPFTTYLLGTLAIAVIAVVVFLLTRKPTPVTTFNVTVKCINTPCKIYDSEGRFLGNDVYNSYLDVGEHKFWIYPKDYPIIDTLIALEPDITGRDSLKTYVIDPERRYRNLAKVHIVILGYAAQKRNVRLNSELHDIDLKVLINGFEYDTDDWTRLSTMLYRSLYEIKFNLSDDKFREIVIDSGTGVRRQNDFRFDFSDTTYANGASLNFYYSVVN